MCLSESADLERWFVYSGSFLGHLICQNRTIRKRKTFYHCFGKLPVDFSPKRICILERVGGKLITE